jgi:hypothetical protein
VLCKFNWGKSRFGDALAYCGEAQHPTGREEELVRAQVCCGEMTLGSGKKRICWTRRHNERERAETREGFVMWIGAWRSDMRPTAVSRTAKT